MKSIQKRFCLAVRWMLYKLLHLAEMPLWVSLSTPSHGTYLYDARQLLSMKLIIPCSPGEIGVDAIIEHV